MTVLDLSHIRLPGGTWRREIYIYIYIYIWENGGKRGGGYDGLQAFSL